MIYKKLRYVVSLSIIIFFIHSIEEYLTKLYEVDHSLIAISAYLNLTTKNVYLASQIILFAFLIVFLASLLKDKLYKPLAIMLGVIFVFELTHIYSVISIAGYYPGLYTGIMLLIIGFFYWKELFKMLKVFSS
jgi:hypothetical protein